MGGGGGELEKIVSLVLDLLTLNCLGDTLREKNMQLYREFRAWRHDLEWR